jgi:hypothetical protein
MAIHEFNWSSRERVLNLSPMTDHFLGGSAQAVAIGRILLTRSKSPWPSY